MAERSLGRSVGNLVLALLNATLILVALCLWMAWSALSTAERVSGQIGHAAETVLPLRAEIATLTEEVVATRTELAERRSEGAAENRAEIAALEARLAGVQAQLAELTAAVTALGVDPEVLIDRAVASALEGLGASVSDVLSSLRGAPTPGAP